MIGYGYDLTCDIRLTGCKPGPSGSTLIELDGTLTKDLVVPGGVVVPNVSSSIKCDKGERTRFRSDVVSFNQVGMLPIQTTISIVLLQNQSGIEVM